MNRVRRFIVQFWTQTCCLHRANVSFSVRTRILKAVLTLAVFSLSASLANSADSIAANASPTQAPIPSAAVLRPVSYDGFVDAKTYPSVEQAIAHNRYVYLRPGVYVLNNPVIIDRDTPLFIHGGSRMDTVLKPKDPTQPLFIVRRAPLLNFSGVYFLGARVPEYRNILFENVAPVQFEMQDCFFDRGVLDMKGPGSYRLQGTYVTSRGLSRAALLVDHPQADFISVGGNMSSGEAKRPRVTDGQIFNVWQKHGRVRIYGVGIQGSVGVADFRIDSASVLGPHVLAYVRSEGTNAYGAGSLASSLLYVPSSAEKVDVMMVANAGMWPLESRSINHLLDYNAAGTVWMIANSAPTSADHIAIGQAPGATIVTMGNRIFSGNRDPLPIQAKLKYNLGNTYSYADATGDKTFPNVRFLSVPGALTSINTVPELPAVPLPDPLPRPVMNRALPGMLDVKRDFGARGDGVADDTAALQTAMVSGKEIYIPAGIYRTTRTLGFAHSRYGGKAWGAGGWIAGAGMNKTIIRRDTAQKGSVFATEGMAYITIQGISFETADYQPRAADPISQSAVELEFNPDFRGAFATQEVMFYDCRFKGGRHAASIGLSTGTMGSENMFINSEFSNAGFGLAIGSYNALNNIAYGSVFRNNEITIGQDKTRNTGGSGALLNVNVTGTKVQEIAVHNTSGEPWYFNGVTSNSGKLFSAADSSIAFMLVFDQCRYDPLPATQSLGKSLAGGGFYFLNSSIASGALDVSSAMSVLPIFSLHSKFRDISRTRPGINGRVYLQP